jgi:hypothetical protein
VFYSQYIDNEASNHGQAGVKFSNLDALVGCSGVISPVSRNDAPDSRNYLLSCLNTRAHIDEPFGMNHLG